MKNPLRSAAAVLVLLLTSHAEGETLSANGAVSRAAKHNPSLKAALYDLAAAKEGVAAEEGARIPTLFLGASGEYNENFNGSSRGISRNDSEALNGNGGVRYTTDVGTALELGFSNGVSWRSTNLNPSTTETVTIGPNYSSQVYATARQPLLKGAGSDAVNAQLVQAEASKTQAERERDQAASQLALDVLRAYWELWYAERAVAVQTSAINLAEQQVAEAKARVEVLGSIPGTDVLRFATELAAIRETLAGAQATRATRAVELGRLLGMKPKRARALNAKAAPPPIFELPPLDALTQAAREQSSELLALDAQVDAAQKRVDAADALDKPTLDLISTTTMAGLWNADTITTLTLPGGRPAFSVMLALEFEVPLGRSAASAEAGRARAQRDAAEARYEARAEEIDAEVASLHIELENTRNAMGLADETAEMAAQLAQAERQRLELGTTTPLEVVRAQQSQREAELRRLRALVDHVLAALALEHHTGGLLSRYAGSLKGKGSH